MNVPNMQPCNETRPMIVALNALQVISLDERISNWLSDNDPKALEQVRHAISALLTVPSVKVGSEYVDLR